MGRKKPTRLPNAIPQHLRPPEESGLFTAVSRPARVAFRVSSRLTIAGGSLRMIGKPGIAGEAKENEA